VKFFNLFIILSSDTETFFPLDVLFLEAFVCIQGSESSQDLLIIKDLQLS
jgi:hypothetical protein